MGGPRPWLTFLVWLVAVASVLFVWKSFCEGKVKQTAKFLFSLQPLLLSGPLGLALARLAGPEAFGVAAFQVTAWFAGMLPIKLLKHKFGRRRPAVTEKIPGPSRFISILTKINSQDSRASFPSGDSSAAVAYALPLAFGCGWPLTALLTVLLTNFAVMYWRAHWALDVAVGTVIGLVVGVMLHLTICPIGAVVWWQPIAAQALMISFTMVLRRFQ
mmetsp:Transcript_73941/g.228482  ORF Transcript_73941/g.228482 Transcript_73941/m.228482 type:complete len:216 (-) Transcript_73941:553-1200(-)